MGTSVENVSSGMPTDAAAPPDRMLTADYMGTDTTPPTLAVQIAGIGAFMQSRKRVDKAPSKTDAEHLFDRQFAQGVANGACSQIKRN